MSEFINEKDLQKLKSKIETDIESIKVDIQRLEEATKPISPENSIGRLTRMDAINNKSVNEASLNASKSKLNQLKRSLEKLNDPEFGMCICCEEPIPLPRLMVMPETRVCVGCAD